MKKKIAALCLCAALLAVAVIGGTLAFFTDTDDKDNVFTVGGIDIVLEEPKWDEEGSVDAKEAYPGEALNKDPQIKNVGANPCFVRLQITGWDALIKAGLSKNNITWRTDYVDGKLGDNWVLGEDGYFYYLLSVEAGGVPTDAVFDQIVIPSDVTNGDAVTEYTIDVNAYGVQAQGMRTSYSSLTTTTPSAVELANWFATCGF